ncbi:MAG: type II toxin-antitoxin system VapC family toxin [Acidobacteria bacterium]|nr:type II toxin-antitoxin system VapC family toxin [Acidobacteriota bacterium]
MGPVVADTHAVLWYLLKSTALSPSALAALREAVRTGDRIYVASISLVETTYLVEKGRAPRIALDRLTEAVQDVGTNLELVSLSLAVAQAVRSIPREVVPDMPDRIIAATALHLSLPLITRDRRIQAANVQTIW